MAEKPDITGAEMARISRRYYQSNRCFAEYDPLVAAAPALLASCKALLNCIDSARYREEAKAARAAISHAEKG